MSNLNRRSFLPIKSSTMPSCNHSNRTKLYSTNGYSIVQCGNCSFRKTFPMPSQENIAKIYDKEFYSNKNSRRFGVIGEMMARFFRFLRALEIGIFYAPRRILDVGCGRGLMLYYLKEYFGASYVIGTQYSNAAIEYAKNKLDIEVKKGDLSNCIQAMEKNLDIICFWHVLEHIDDVDLYIQLSYKLLKKAGKLLVEVPNSDSFSEKITGGSWMGWDTPNHLTHFTPDSLSMLFKKHGFTIVKRRYFSAEYSIFTTVQSFLNKISGKWNLFYNFLLVGRKRSGTSLEIIGHILLAAALTPLAFLLNLILYNSKHGEVIHYVARK